MPEPLTPQEPGARADATATTVPADATDATDTPFDVVLTVSEPADVGPLFRRLRGVPEATVTRRRSGPAAGELGVTEVLQLLVPSSAVLAVAIRTLPAFIRSRRSSVTVTLTWEDRSVTVSGENLDDPQQVIGIANRLLGDE